ncbi:MAG: glycosyltransferase family 2 protein [Betaproteobacteria bacterium]|nr:glycosyltransferase family 2 protein [Betaproteobacteria bacterium]
MSQFPDGSVDVSTRNATNRREGANPFSATQPGVTVIVCTRDRPVQLDQCLESLAQQTCRRFDVLVVDNASAHPAREICRRRGVSYMYEPVPGLTRARNLGARAARGEVVAYIDDDATPEPGWLDALVRDFEDPAVAAVSGRIRYMKAHGDTRTMSNEEASSACTHRPRGSVDKGTPDWFALACFGGIGDGSSMAFRRAVIERSVAFDERLGRGRLLEGGDEHVAFMSLIASGHRITHAPDAVVRHPYPATPALERARRLRDLRNAIANLMFLWGEFPAHHVDIARFLYRAVLKRVAGSVTRLPGSARLPRWLVLKAMLGGCLVYWKARREWTGTRGHRREEVGRSSSGSRESALIPRRVA